MSNNAGAPEYSNWPQLYSQKPRSRGAASPRWERLAWLPSVLLLLLTVLLWRNNSVSYGSPYLINFLNFLLSTFVSLVACFLLGWAFMVRGLPGIILLGCTCLITGSSSFGLGVGAQYGTNVMASTFILNGLFAGLCNFAGVLLLLRVRREVRARGLWLTAIYGGALIAVQALFVAVTAGWTPLFFVHGRGGTPVRQATAAAAIVLFVVSALLMRIANRRDKDDFTRWYALSLDLRAIGLIGAFGNLSLGSPLFWVSRAGIYLGGAYLVIAGIKALRETHAWRTTLEEALGESEHRLQQLSDNLPGSAVFQFERGRDGRPRFLYISGGIEQMCGVKSEAVLQDASVLMGMTLPEDAASVAERTRASLRDLSVFEVELRLRLPDGRLRWMRLVSRPRRLADGRTVWDGVQIDITERKQMEEALRESQSKLDAAFNGMTDGVFTTDATGRLQEYNEAFLTFNRFKSRAECSDFQASLHELCEFSLLTGEPVPPEGRPSRRALRGETNANAEYLLRRIDTGETWVGSFSFAPIRDKDGAIAGAVVVARDVTEHKRTDEALLASRAKLDAALDSTTDAIFITDANGRLLEFNRATTAFYRLAAVPFNREHFAEYRAMIEFIDPDGAPVAHEERPIARALRGEIGTNAIYTILRKDTGEQWVGAISFAPVRDKAGAIVGSVIVARDITESKRAEQRVGELLAETTALAAELAEREAQLKASKYRLEAALSAAHMGVWTRALSSSQTNWDDRMREMWGLAKDETVTLDRMLNAIVPEDQEAVRSAMKARAQGEIGISVEFRIQRPDGIRWLHSRGSGIRGPSGSIDMVAGVMADITESKVAAEQVQSLQAQLAQAQKMEAIGRLAGGVAHDFNNMLTVINGHAFLAGSKLPANDRTRVHLAEIAKAGERAAALTAQLLAFSRKQILQPRRFDLNQMLADSTSILRRMVGEDVRLELSPTPAPCPVNADPHQLEQVLFNLSANARDAMPLGGHLRIQTAVAEADPAEGEPQLRGHRRVVLTVSDDGAGMDEATQRRIFEPFFTTKDVGKGTGLGLSTVQGIIDQSGGLIEVESVLGRGTTFRIELPFALQPEAEAPASVPAPDLRGSETILVVEDQPEVLEFLAEVLEGYGYRVLTVSGGEQALRLWQQGGEPIDLLVTDVVMPDMSGSVLVGKLRAISPDAKFLFISGYTDDVMVRHGVRGQGAAFLQKPFRPAELAVKVRSVLGPRAAKAN